MRERSRRRSRAAARMDRAAIESLQLERVRSVDPPCVRAQRVLSAQVRRAERESRGSRLPLPDLARFPFTTKSDLRDAYPFGFFAVPMHEVARVKRPRVPPQADGGGYTRQDIATWSGLVARSIRAAGGRRGMKVHSPTATDSLPGDSARITARKRRAAPSSRCPADRLRGRSSSSWISGPTSS